MAPDPERRPRLTAGPEGSPTTTFLLLSATGEAPAPLRHDAEAVAAAGHRVRWAISARQGGLTGRRLSPAASPERTRRVLLGASARVAGPERRARLAARFDPWFARAARNTAVILATDPEALEMLAVADDVAPVSLRFGPDQASRVLAERRLGDELDVAAATALGAGREEMRRAGFGAELLSALRAVPADADTVRLDRQQLHLLLARLARWSPPALLAELAGAALALPGVGAGDAVTAAFGCVAELDAEGRTETAVGPLVRRLLEAVDAYHAAGERALVVQTAGLALDLLFHRELHSDVERSELVEHPGAYVAALRNSVVGDLLTRPVPPLPPPPPDAAAVPAGTTPEADSPAAERSVREAVVLRGAYGTTYRPLSDALAADPRTRVQVLDLGKEQPNLRTMSMDLSLLRYRLDRAQGRPGQALPAVVDGLAGADVVVANWADKGALLASLDAPADCRLTVRVHSVDALRPWLQLIDWSRVEALVCVSAHVGDLVAELLGDRLRGVHCEVVGNGLELARFTDVAPDLTPEPAAAPHPDRSPTPAQTPDRNRDRTLGLIGWAQRVKDPLFAVEVLARLRASDPAWRLRLIGADFAEVLPASGRVHAERFRARAMSDDVREAIDYVAFTEDLPSEVVRLGFVLSCSVRESWPVGPLEAVAAGAVPVVRDWPVFAGRDAARRLLPNEWVVDDVEAAVARITSLAEPDARSRAAADARAEVVGLADPQQVARDLRRITLGPYAELPDLVATGHDAEAMALLQRHLDADAEQVLLRAGLDVARITGDTPLRFDLTDRIAEAGPTPRQLEGMRRALARIRETSPDWVPTVSPLPDATTPDRPEETGPVPGRVLHVLKLSAPQRETGYAVRAHYTVQGQQQAGLDVLAVTALDFPSPSERDDLSPAAGTPLSPSDDLTPTDDPDLSPTPGSDRPLQDPDLPPGLTVAEQEVTGVRHLRLLRDDVPEAEPSDRYLDAYATALAAVIRRERVDVVHVHSGHRGFEAALVALSAARATSRPVVYEVRGFFESLWGAGPGRAERGETYRARLATEERCMRAAAAVVTLSESMRAELVGRGVEAETAHVVPNAVDAELFPPRDRSAELAERWGLTGRFVFGYVSNLDHEREGHELLIEAAVRLCRQGVPATALVVGDGVRGEELRALAERMGAGEAVVFTGRVPHAEVQDHYALCDVFVIPRIDERAARLVTPLKPYEAMAMQIPLLVSDLPALREVVGQGERGRSFRPGDVDDLVQVLGEIRDDPDAAAATAAHARDWVLSERTWAANAERYRRIYDELPRRAPDWPTAPVVEDGPERSRLLAELDALAGARPESDPEPAASTEPDLRGLRWRRQRLRRARATGSAASDSAPTEPDAPTTPVTPTTPAVLATPTSPITPGTPDGVTP